MTQTATFSNDFALPRKAGFFADLRKRWADYQLYRRTLIELQGLSDRELLDLGISRFAIRRLAWESVYAGNADAQSI